MSQLSLYMPEDEMNLLKKKAEKENLSLSAFARKLLNEKGNTDSSKADVPSWWSSAVADWWSQVAGKLTDETFITPADSELDPKEIMAWS